MISTNDIQTLLDSNGTVVDESGQKVGKVGQVYLDDATGNPEWVTAKTGLFGNAETFIPLAQASVQGSEVRVPYSKDKIKDAPRLDDSDGHITPEQESELYRYYGLDSSGGVGGGRSEDTDSTYGTEAGRGTETGYRTEGTSTEGRGTVGRDTSGPTTDEAMTRSEEQLQVGTEKVNTGKARLRKYVVTENVTKTVPVQREEVRLEREPITDANIGDATAGPDLSDEEHEVTLSEERVVVDKETVPVERVRLDKETVTEQEQVSEDVRREEIETDVPGTTGTRDDDRRH